MKNKCIFLLIGLLWGVTAYAGEGADSGNIVARYNDLTRQYETKLESGNYWDAYFAAEEQLVIDPSDAMAYMRLAVAAHYVVEDGREVIERYSHSVSESDRIHRELKSLANAMLRSQRATETGLSR